MVRYYLINLLLAPGVMVHEIGHSIFCILAGVKIHTIRLFQFGKTAGYVIHEEPRSFFQALLISLGPLIVNSFVALVLFSQIHPPHTSVLQVVYIWLGLATALSAMPSNGDAKALSTTTHHLIWRNPFALLAYPFVVLIFLLNFLKRFHLDIVFAVFIWWLGSHGLKQ